MTVMAAQQCALNATGLYTWRWLKWEILCYVCFATIKTNKGPWGTDSFPSFSILSRSLSIEQMRFDASLSWSFYAAVSRWDIVMWIRGSWLLSDLCCNQHRSRPIGVKSWNGEQMKDDCVLIQWSCSLWEHTRLNLWWTHSFETSS